MRASFISLVFQQKSKQKFFFFAMSRLMTVDDWRRDILSTCRFAKRLKMVYCENNDHNSQGRELTLLGELG